MKINLTGWKAVAALAAFAVFALFRFSTQSAALQTEGVEEVERWLALEAARTSLPDMQAAANTGNDEYLERVAEGLAQENFDVVSVTRHGMGDRIVARVEYRYKGELPPEQPPVRYMRMEHSFAAGWRVQSETSKLSYYLAVF